MSDLAVIILREPLTWKTALLGAVAVVLYLAYLRGLIFLREFLPNPTDSPDDSSWVLWILSCLPPMVAVVFWVSYTYCCCPFSLNYEGDGGIREGIEEDGRDYVGFVDGADLEEGYQAACWQREQGGSVPGSFWGRWRA